jgi:ADP-ribose pyrophosphatase YjhB (NUDIX family)
VDEVYAEHAVSIKIALYSHDGERVLIMVYPSRDGLHGLPGGHLEANEMPDQALIRELDEELGISIVQFEKKSFFLRYGTEGSVILAYSAVAPEGLILRPTRPEKEYAIWMTATELDDIENISAEYKTFVADNWPIR